MSCKMMNDMVFADKSFFLSRDLVFRHNKKPKELSEIIVHNTQ